MLVSGSRHASSGRPALRQVWTRNSSLLPALLRRDLRQQQSRPSAPAEEDAVRADLDLRRVDDAAKRGERGHLDRHLLQLVAREGREPGIVEGAGERHVANGLDERCRRGDVADAAPQSAPDLQGDEGAAGSAKRRSRGGKSEPGALESGGDAAARCREEGLAFVFSQREVRHRPSSIPPRPRSARACPARRRLPANRPPRAARRASRRRPARAGRRWPRGRRC